MPKGKRRKVQSKEDSDSSSSASSELNTDGYVEGNSNCHSFTPTNAGSRDTSRSHRLLELESKMSGNNNVENESRASRESDSIGTHGLSSSKPSNIMVTEALVQPIKPNNLAIAEFVTHQLFPKVKFIVDKDRELAYSTDRSHCKFVVDGLNMDGVPGVREWWESSRKLVRSKISQLCNDWAMGIKWEFYGTIRECLCVEACSVLTFVVRLIGRL